MPPPPALKRSYSFITALKTLALSIFPLSESSHSKTPPITNFPCGLEHTTAHSSALQQKSFCIYRLRAKKSFWRAQGKAWTHRRSNQRELLCCSLLKSISVLDACSQTAQQRHLHTDVPPAPRVSGSILSLTRTQWGQGSDPSPTQALRAQNWLQVPRTQNWLQVPLPVVTGALLSLWEET